MWGKSNRKQMHVFFPFNELAFPSIHPSIFSCRLSYTGWRGDWNLSQRTSGISMGTGCQSISVHNYTHILTHYGQFRTAKQSTRHVFGLGNSANPEATMSLSWIFHRFFIFFLFFFRCLKYHVAKDQKSWMLLLTCKCWHILYTLYCVVFVGRNHLHATNNMLQN